MKSTVLFKDCGEFQIYTLIDKNGPYYVIKNKDGQFFKKFNYKFRDPRRGWNNWSQFKLRGPRGIRVIDGSTEWVDNINKATVLISNSSACRLVLMIKTLHSEDWFYTGA